MDPALGFFLVLFGLPAAIWPYKTAQFEERMDGIGSKRSWSEIEPADWKVALNRIIGIGMLFFGVIGLLAG